MHSYLIALWGSEAIGHGDGDVGGLAALRDGAGRQNPREPPTDHHYLRGGSELIFRQTKEFISKTANHMEPVNRVWVS